MLVGLGGDLGLVVLGPDEGRVLHVAAGEPDDVGGHRGGEEQGLALLAAQRDELLDVGDEAHVEHAVGLVEDEHLHPAEDQVAAPDVVEQPSGRADHDVHRVLAERVALRLERDAAVDREHGGGHVRRRVGEVLGDLDAELARRRDDERLHAAGSRFHAVEQR